MNEKTEGEEEGNKLEEENNNGLYYNTEQNTCTLRHAVIPDSNLAHD